MEGLRPDGSSKKNGFSFGRVLQREDFFEAERMQGLYEQVLDAGLVIASEVDRQLFFGLLVYLRRQSKIKKKAALLTSLLNETADLKINVPWRKRPTTDDLQTAAKLINRVDYGPPIEELTKERAEA